MSGRVRVGLILSLLLVGVSTTLSSTQVQVQTPAGRHRLIVGTKQAPPFAMKQPDGT
jgi:hypothetical protein